MSKCVGRKRSQEKAEVLAKELEQQNQVAETKITELKEEKQSTLSRLNDVTKVKDSAVIELESVRMELSMKETELSNLIQSMQKQMSTQGTYINAPRYIVCRT